MKVTVELTEEEARDVLLTAARGCAYWAETDVSLLRALKHPIEVRERLEENPKPYELTLAKLNEGVARVLDGSSRQGEVARQVARHVNDVDQTAADVIVQLAVFGEIRYC